MFSPNTRAVSLPTGGAGGHASVTFRATGLTTPANDNIQNARVVSGTSGTVSDATNVGATVQRQNNFRPDANYPNEPFHAGNNGGKSVWYKWTAPATGETNFRTRFPNDSTQDTVLGIYAETRPTSSSVRFTPVASNDDIDSGTRRSRASFRAIQNTVYFIAVDSFGGRSGAFDLSWTQVEESQQQKPITRRITRLTNLNDQSLIAVRLGISENVVVKISRWENVFRHYEFQFSDFYAPK